MWKKLSVVVLVCIIIGGGYFAWQYNKNSEIVVNTTMPVEEEIRFYSGVKIAVDYDNKVDMPRLKEPDYIISDIPITLQQEIAAEDALIATNKLSFHYAPTPMETIGNTVRSGNQQFIGGTFYQYEEINNKLLQGRLITETEIDTSANTVIMPKRYVEEKGILINDIYEFKQETVNMFGIVEGEIIIPMHVVGVYDDSDYCAMMDNHYQTGATDNQSNSDGMPCRAMIYGTFGFIESLAVDYGRRPDEREGKIYYLEIYFTTETEREAFIKKYEEKLPDLYSLFLI